MDGGVREETSSAAQATERSLLPGSDEIMIEAGCVFGLLMGCGKTVREHPVKETGNLQQDPVE